MDFLILTLFVLVCVLAKRGAFQPGLPIAYRLSFITLSFLLVWGGCDSVNLSIWGFLHPVAFWEHYYVQSGIYPAAASFAIIITSCIAGWTSYVLGYRLAQQKPVAYLLGSGAAPYLFVASILTFSLQAQQHLPLSRFQYSLCASIVLLDGVFYFWLYSFCKTPRNRELMNKNA